MQVSITVKAWSVGVNEPPDDHTGEHHELLVDARRLVPRDRERPADCQPGGFVSETVITGALDPWAHAGAVIVTW